MKDRKRKKEKNRKKREERRKLEIKTDDFSHLYIRFEDTYVIYLIFKLKKNN